MNIELTLFFYLSQLKVLTNMTFEILIKRITNNALKKTLTESAEPR